jgi:hypothetical protein
MRALKVICGAVALAALLAPGASADEWNKRTYLTFSGPVQIPGATLPAGSYTFEIANPDTTRHVIRVSQKDTNKPLALFMTIPNERLEAPADNLIMFAERPAGSPQAIQVWFYPGDRVGEEFVYPKSQAVKIAKANRVGVLATDGGGVVGSDQMAAMKTAKVGRVDESGRMTEEHKNATSTTTAGTTAAPANTATGRNARPETTTARAETAPRSTTAQRNATGTSGTQDTTANRRRELPRTGSNFVMIELLSALALAGGLGARRLRRAAEAR